MIKVIIIRKDGAEFQGSFPSKEEAEKWVAKHKAKGKDAVIVSSPNRIVGATVLESTTDFMGNTVLRQELPAEYTVEYIDEHLADRDNKWEQLRKDRSSILKGTDWLMLSDVKTVQKHRKIYIEYRQYLRDLPQNITKDQPIEFEAFENWIKRKYPEEFLDGGDGTKMVNKFTSYL